MVGPPGGFGAELRRRRMAADLSLSALADRVHYSRSHLSRIETSAKAPSVSLARRCDTALSAGGALASLAERTPVAATAAGEVVGGDRWRVTMSADGLSEFSTVPHDAEAALTARWTLTFPAAAGAFTAAARAFPAAARGGGGPVFGAFEAMFRQVRVLGQTVPPATVLPMLVAQTHALRVLAVGHPAGLLLAARFAEYAGWMSQEAGDDRTALWWTGQAVELATAAGDRDFAPYALVRGALIALYQGDSVTTVAQAERAQAADCSPRVRGLAAQREAQGRAIDGDHIGCFRALDRAARLLDANPADAGMIGSWAVRDPVAATTGWCLYDLGRPAQAAEILCGELAHIPASAVRARARYGARLALAYAAADEIEQACEVAAAVLAVLPTVDSATIRTDVRDLRRALSRRPANPAVRDLMPRLATSLTLPAQRTR